jgi:hypothetical protein
MQNSPSGDRIELVLAIPDTVTTAQLMPGNGQPEEIVLRGSREQVANLLLKALASLTGDPVMGEFVDYRELLCAVRTLGECGALGLVSDPHDELSDRQKEVIDKLRWAWEFEALAAADAIDAEEQAAETQADQE